MEETVGLNRYLISSNPSNVKDLDELTEGVADRNDGKRCQKVTRG